MFGWIKGRARCLRGKHERSHKHARLKEGSDRYTSICMYCRVPMERRTKRDWVVAPRS